MRPIPSHSRLAPTMIVTARAQFLLDLSQNTLFLVCFAVLGGSGPWSCWGDVVGFVAVSDAVVCDCRGCC